MFRKNYPTLVLLAVFLVIFVSLGAQNPDKIRYIDVTGSAEMDLAPDEITLEIVLSNYKKVDVQNDLDRIEKKFFSALEKNNITSDQWSLGNNGQYYWYYWWSYSRRNSSRKVYTVTLDANTDFLKLMKDLDFAGVTSLRISNTTSDKLQEKRQEVKIMAIKAAKTKAEYLLESIDESLGRVLYIEEVQQNGYSYYRQNQVSNVVMSSSNSGGEIDHVAKIKVRYEIKARFAIAD